MFKHLKMVNNIGLGLPIITKLHCAIIVFNVLFNYTNSYEVVEQDIKDSVELVIISHTALLLRYNTFNDFTSCKRCCIVMWHAARALFYNATFTHSQVFRETNITPPLFFFSKITLCTQHRFQKCCRLHQPA